MTTKRELNENERSTMPQIRKAIGWAKHCYPNCRAGQAMANCWILPKQLEDLIYESISTDEVAGAIFGWYNNKSQVG